MTTANTAAIDSAVVGKWDSPVYNYIFHNELPIPPPIYAKNSNTDPNGKRIDYYEVSVDKFEKKIYPNLPGVAHCVGYNGISPGPTFQMTRGVESLVRFINNNTRPAGVHLHGSPSRTMFDGWAEDIMLPGQYKDYYWPNYQSARTLWYHDHSIGITAVNAYMGQAGMYVLTDPAQEATLGFPQGKHDIPIVLTAKQYDAVGELVSPEFERTSLYGDVIHVNGQPWPYMNVEPRKYRFRVLDAAISRSFNLTLQDPLTQAIVPFHVIGSDAGYLDHIVPSNSLVIAMAERWEIVVDFAGMEGKNITMKNQLQFQTNIDYAATDRVMQFRVGKTTPTNPKPLDNDLPSPLVKLVNLEIPSSAGVLAMNPARTFKFERSHGQWLINGVGFEDPVGRILAKPELGDTEIWTLENGSGGWSHPIHIHLIDFQVISRSGRGVEPYEAAALKDVVYLGTNEKVQVIAKYLPWAGEYMFHCHNLVHEDHDMMGAFKVGNKAGITAGNELAYADPMDPKWRANTTSFAPVATKQWLGALQALGVYNDHELIKAMFVV